MTTQPFGRFFLRASLAREITILLVLKVLALMFMSHMFFNPADRIDVTAKVLGQHLLSPLDETRP